MRPCGLENGTYQGEWQLWGRGLLNWGKTSEELEEHHTKKPFLTLVSIPCLPGALPWFIGGGAQESP